MRKWITGLYAIVAVAAIVLVVLLTQPKAPEVPPTTAPSTVPTQPTEPPTVPTEPAGEVRLYQCDPALAQKWNDLAQRYTAETGVKVTILTAGGDCASSLPTYMEGDGAATIFCLHHAQDLTKWKDACLDLTGSAIANALHQDIFALKDGEAILGVAGNIESYGIIYNSKLLARAGYTASDIQDFASLKNAVQNITANKRSLGFSAFASPDLTDTSHGALLCLLAGLSEDDSVLRNFWDLYISNNVRSGAALTQTNRNDSLNDFLSGKAVFYLGGTWDYEALSQIEDYYLGMLPVYTGEEQGNLGLHHSCTNYWCVNAQSSELDQAASLDFLAWLVTAGESTPAPVDYLELLTPYVDTKHTGNPLGQLVLDSMEKDQNSINWNSCDELSPELLAQFGQALATYTKKPNDENWEAITSLSKAE